MRDLSRRERLYNTLALTLTFGGFLAAVGLAVWINR